MIVADKDEDQANGTVYKYTLVCVCLIGSITLSSLWQWKGSEVWAPWKLPIGPQWGRTSCKLALFLLDRLAGIHLFVEI